MVYRFDQNCHYIVLEFKYLSKTKLELCLNKGFVDANGPFDVLSHQEVNDYVE